MATRMIRGQVDLLYEERLRELVCSFLRRLRGDLITFCQYIKDGYQDDGKSLSSRSPMEKTRGDGYKLLLE